MAPTVMRGRDQAQDGTGCRPWYCGACLIGAVRVDVSEIVWEQWFAGLC